MIITYANSNINKLHTSVTSIVVFLIHQNQNCNDNGNECYSNHYRQNYTYSHITQLTQHTQPRHFIKFPVLLLQLLECKTLLP